MNAETRIETPSLNAALVKALAEIGGAAKDKINPAFKSKYADLQSVIDAIKPVLANHGLGFTQHTEPSEDGVIVETFVRHDSGATESLGKLYVPANKKDAQGFGSALTYARRYSLMTAFGVPAEDDDGNAASRPAPRADPAPVRMATDEQRDNAEMVTDAECAHIMALVQASGVPLGTVLKRAHVGKLTELTNEAASSVIKKLNLTIKQKSEAVEDVLEDSIPY